MQINKFKDNFIKSHSPCPPPLPPPGTRESVYVLHKQISAMKKQLNCCGKVIVFRMESHKLKSTRHILITVQCLCTYTVHYNPGIRKKRAMLFCCRLIWLHPSPSPGTWQATMSLPLSVSFLCVVGKVSYSILKRGAEPGDGMGKLEQWPWMSCEIRVMTVVWVQIPHKSKGGIVSPCRGRCELCNFSLSFVLFSRMRKC
jgi:hypothetical protein